MAAEKAKLKEKIVILNYYRVAKAVTCFINICKHTIKKANKPTFNELIIKKLFVIYAH